MLIKATLNGQASHLFHTAEQLSIVRRNNLETLKVSYIFY